MICRPTGSPSDSPHGTEIAGIATDAGTRTSHVAILARSLGITANRATTVAEAIDLLKQALADGGPALIEVTLDRAFKPM